MIQILLFLLKIIGIVLLVILGLVLLVLLLVLFAPIRYRIRAVRTPERTEVSGRVSFLFPLMIVRFGWLEKLWYRIRIFGKVLLDSEKPKEEKSKKEKPKKIASRKEKKKTDVNPDGEVKGPKQQESLPELPKATSTKEQEKHQEPPRGTQSKKAADKEKKGFFQKLRVKWEKVRNTVSNIIAKISRLLRQKDELVRIIADEKTKQVLSFVLGNGKRLFKHILPGKLKGYVKYGSSDPATTGQVLGIISILYAMTGPVVTILPNFEEEQLECDLECRGRIRIATLLAIAINVIKNKELKQVISEFKNIKDIE